MKQATCRLEDLLIASEKEPFRISQNQKLMICPGHLMLCQGRDLEALTMSCTCGWDRRDEGCTQFFGTKSTCNKS
jgi:hypothetical protein